MTIAEKILRAKDDYDAVYEAGKKAVSEVLKFTDVASTAYRSTVPNGVEPFAKVNKIGGMSYKSANLIPFPYNGNQSNTSNGITYIQNEDGTLTVNGTSTGRSYYIIQQNIRLPNGVKVTLSGCPSGGSVQTYSIYINATVNGEWRAEYYDTGNGVSFDSIKNAVYSVTIYGAWAEGITHSNLVFKPMLNLGDTALPYKPYFAGLRSAKVDELKSEGANLIPFPYYHASGLNRQGITFTYGENGIVTLDGISTGYSEMLLFENKQLKAGTYVLRAFGADGSLVSVLQMYKNSSWVRNIAADEGNGKTFTITDEDVKNHVFTLNIYVGKVNTDFTNRQIKPMLVYGSTIPNEYKPYVGTLDTLTIPEAVKSLDGYGLGVDSEYYNYIDFERKVFVQMTKRVAFDGTEEWVAGDTDDAEKWRLHVSLPDDNVHFIDTSTKSKLVCNQYATTTAGGTWMRVQGVANHESALWIYDENYTSRDVSLWKAHLAELYASGNPLTVDYALKTPIETDISAYLTDEYIEVEGGGTITAVNEYEYDVPTNISYLVDTQEG